MKVIKRSGDIVDFDRKKLENSLLRSGAMPSVASQVLAGIDSQLHEGITTKQIYKQAFAMLRRASNAHAARYNLRTALLHLGPAGFFFEKFIARLYAAQGWQTATNLMLQGNCVSHEVDIAMRRDGVIIMAECKFHNSREAISDVKVPLYILSRFNDLKPKKHELFGISDHITQCLIVTNNRFSADAVTFANCSGMQLLSWDLPANGSISLLTDRNGLYPVTCLTTLTAIEKEKLLILDILLVKEVLDHSDCLHKIGISENRIKNVLKECSELRNT
ncbi:hypothetical protein HYN59_15275 [Flavobacterium album]|uniref:ATP-cone domain-containing protein n=1 Tax=Flavobacterium album TaxID=2175091 RepID=A0A2S1R1C9_9FLAO|nr:ATP cone domain-containing protein [Flavobacterium album]AWH86386.1 hypothetical protein HYN59_15275 [Flavobacterium album]